MLDCLLTIYYRKAIKPSFSWFSFIRKAGMMSTCFLPLLVELNETIYIRDLANCTACRKYSISVFWGFFVFNFWLRWAFVAGGGLSLVAASGGYSSLRCVGFSLQWLLLLWSTGSRLAGFSGCGSWVLERRLSSCDARA